jgi:hypothetical protein
MKNAVFWDVTLSGSCKNGHFTRAIWHNIPEDGILHTPRSSQEEPGQKDICNSWCRVSVTFPVNVAEATHYIGNTRRPLAMWLHEHRYILKGGPLEKSKLIQRAHKKSHRVSWNEDRKLKIVRKSSYRKYKDLTYMACLTRLISRNSVDISPTWILLISNDVTNWKRSVVVLDSINLKLSIQI